MTGYNRIATPLKVFGVKNAKCAALPYDGTDFGHSVIDVMNDAEREIYLPQIFKQGLEGRNWVGHIVETMPYYLIL